MNKSVDHYVGEWFIINIYICKSIGQRKEAIIMNDVLYKTGELAKLAGVSVRTIRYYDSKGILKPIGLSDSGYRLYNIQALEKMQKIVMFD